MTTSAQHLYQTRWRFYVAMIALIGHRRSLKRFFQKRKVLASGTKVVDVGCGSGALTRALYELSQKQHLTEIQFFGLDLTPEMLRPFQRWIDDEQITNIHLFQRDILTLPVSDIPHQADLVVTSGMLEYIPRDQFVDALKILQSFLSANGRLFVFISRTGLHNSLLVARLWHAYLYAREELLDSFKKAGLRVVRLEPFKTWGFAAELSQASSEPLLI